MKPQNPNPKKFKPPPKRKKVETSTDRASISQSTVIDALPYEKRQTDSNLVRKTMVQEAQTDAANARIQQGKEYAMAQLKQDGCTGNFRVFDSPFGNFLIPVIPTRAELGG